MAVDSIEDVIDSLNQSSFILIKGGNRYQVQGTNNDAGHGHLLRSTQKRSQF